MLNKLLNLSLIPFVAFNYHIDIKAIENNTKNYDSIIINDIKNINYLIDNDFFTRIEFIQKTLKSIKVLGWVTNWKKWETRKIIDFNNTIDVDIKNKKVRYNLFPEYFSYKFIDPDPYWCDPAGSKWNDKTKDIKINFPLYKICNLNQNKEWYGNKYDSSLKIDKSNWIDDDINLSYPPHNYFTHSITMYINGGYYVEPVSKNIVIKEINNSNIINSFIAIKKPKITNNGLVWNINTIAKNENLFSFNENLINLKTIAFAKECLIWLDDFLNKNSSNNQWTNQFFEKNEIIQYINDIKQLKFNNYNDLLKFKESIENNKKYNLNGDFSDELNKLNINLINEGLISSEQKIDLNNAINFYETVILFLKTNNIFANITVNDIKYDIPIWYNQSFSNFYENLKNEDINLLNIHFNKMHSKSITDKNSKIICKNLNVTNFSYLKSLDFAIMYRHNALNINETIIEENINDGILLNLNKYVSEIVGIGKQINNYEKNYIIDKENVLKFANEIFNKTNIFNQVIDITNENKSLIYTMFGDKFNDACKQIANDNIFEFEPNNYDGKFYTILKIDNWKFIDGTNGDYTNSFKNRFYNLTEYGKSIIELNRIDRNFDNSGYFLVKLRTNKIIFDFENNKLKIFIDNSTIKQELSKWYIDLFSSDNWKINKIVKNENDFLYSIRKQYLEIYNKKYDQIKNVMINLKIDLSYNASPYEKQEKQFLKDMYNSPLFNHCKIDFNDIRIIKKNNYAYIANKNSNYLNCKINLFDFCNFFYNESLNKIKNDMIPYFSNWIDEYNNVIQSNYKLEKKVNFIPTLFTFCSSVIIFLIIFLFIKNIRNKKINN